MCAGIGQEGCKILEKIESRHQEYQATSFKKGSHPGLESSNENDSRSLLDVSESLLLVDVLAGENVTVCKGEEHCGVSWIE